MSEQFGEDLILIERLAFGGMAEVFLAKNVGHGGFEKTVAVKRILPQYNARPEFQAMFEREMKICAHLQHPNIVQIYRNGIWNDYLYLVMEFVNGKTVLKLLEVAEAKGEFLPCAIACYIVRETARGLAYAHNCVDPISGEHLSIVHRDISPHNLMISYTGEVKILDFGIARAADTADLTRTGELKGKIPYMSPEIIEGGMPTRRSDIFSLGVVLYELLALRRLFAGGSTFQTMRKIREHQIPPLCDINPDVPQELEFITYRMLARDEVERYQNASEVERDLTNFMQREYPQFDHSHVAHYVTGIFKEDIADERRSRSVSMATVLTEIPGSDARESGGSTVGNKIRKTGAYSQPQDKGTVLDIPVQKGGEKRWWLSAVLLASIIITIVFGLVARQREVVANSAKPLDPGAVQSLTAWFNADTIDLPDHSKIDHWVSTTATAPQAVQADFTAQPLLTKRAIGAHSVVTFDGARQFLTADDLAQPLSMCPSRSVIYVVSPRGDKVQYVVSAHQGDKEGDIFRVGFSQGHRARIKQTGDSGRYEDSNPISTDGFAVYSALFEPERAQLYKNGTPLIDAVIRGVESARTRYVSIGQEWDGPKPSDFFSGDVAQILVYCRKLTENERLGIEKWLEDLYAIPAQGQSSPR